MAESMADRTLPWIKICLLSRSWANEKVIAKGQEDDVILERMVPCLTYCKIIV